jgi:hypothetical protein
MIDVPAGHLYLGEQIAASSRKRDGTAVLLDAADLTTHGVVVGMTGSGKTGLGVVLVEEALLAGVPTLVLDPKGDLGNLLLTFPDLVLPELLEVGDEARDDDDVQRTRPEDLVRDVDVVRSRIARRGDVHLDSVDPHPAAGQRQCPGQVAHPADRRGPSPGLGGSTEAAGAAGRDSGTQHREHPETDTAKE